MKLAGRLCAAVLTLAPAIAAAQALGTQTTAPVSAGPEAPAVRAPAETEVQIEITSALSSRTSHQGEMFGLRLAAPLVVDGREIAPAGTVGAGEVIDAVHSGIGGRQGRLIVSARYLDLNGRHVRIHGMQITANGEDRANTSMAVSMIPVAGVAGIFIHGGEIDIPVGARGTAKLAEPVELPAPPPEPPSDTDTTNH